MAPTFSDLLYRLLNAVLAYHVDAVRAHEAAMLAQTPRRSQEHLRTMYVAPPPDPVGALERATKPQRLPPRLAPAGVAALGVIAVIVIAIALTSPPSA